MGLKLYPSALKKQVKSIADSLKDDNENLVCILEVIGHFTGNPNLKSEAWDSMKAHMDDHETVIQGLICANDIVIQNSETLCVSIGEENIDEDELNAQIVSLKNLNNSFETITKNLELCLNNAILSGTESFNYFNSISYYESCIQANILKINELTGKIEKLYQIEGQTNSLYSESKGLYEAVESGLLSIQIAWNASTGQFDVSKINKKWRNVIRNEWKERKENIENKYVTPSIITELLTMSSLNIDTSSTLWTTIKALATKCDLVREGDYIIVKGTVGLRKDIEVLKDIKGTRYKINSPAYFNAHLNQFLPKNERNFSKIISKTTSNLRENGFPTLKGTGFLKETFTFQEKDILGNAGRAVGYLSVVSNIGEEMYDNYLEGETEVSEYISDAVVEGVAGIGSMAVSAGCAKVGAALGTAIPIPVVGTVVGAVAGFGIGYIGAKVYDSIVTEDLKEMASEFVEEGAEYIKDCVGGFFSKVGEAIGTW